MFRRFGEVGVVVLAPLLMASYSDRQPLIGESFVRDVEETVRAMFL